MKKILYFLIMFVLLLTACQPKAKEKTTDFQNPDLSNEQRINDLISRMSLEQKVSQLIYQSKALDSLGVPEYGWWNEALHGVARSGLATCLPQSIGLAATWDEELMHQCANVISDEGRAKYNEYVAKGKSGIYTGLTFWSPNINIFRDPRWGRGMETYGEDPYLTGRMGLQFTKGLQGDDPKYFKTIATPKHYAVHSGPEALRHTFDANTSEFDLWNTYFPAFRTCIQEGNAQSVMCAYNRFRGDACCGSEFLLNDVLRKKWGFSGYVVSDCGAIEDIFVGHKIAKSMDSASAIGLKAGTDLCCGDEYKTLMRAVEMNLVSVAVIDTAVKRLFSARMKLGMFDPADRVPYSKLGKNDVCTKQNSEVALQAARKSIVLLKNNGILPLKKDIKSVAVIGPNAHDIDVLLGNYMGYPAEYITPLTGIINKLSPEKVNYAEGCVVAEFESNPNKSYAIGAGKMTEVSSSALFTAEDKKENGLNAEYFNNDSLYGKPLFRRVDKDVNFRWWMDAPRNDMNDDHFSVRWTGIFVPDKTGEYKLGVEGYNVMRLYINDTLIVKIRNRHDLLTQYRRVNFIAGKSYKIKIEMVNYVRHAIARLLWATPNPDKEKEAIDAAKKSDAVVLFMGLSPTLEGEEMDVPVKGFKGGDRVSLDIPEVQENLLKKIKALGKPIILVLLNGSALSVNWAAQNADAIVEAWYPGQGGGTAIADVLFGDYNPAGRLPVTFYKSANDLPPFDDYGMKGKTYRYFIGEPLYPFGYGLSYTTFNYSDLKIDQPQIKSNGTAKVSVKVTNTGKMDGEEVVQLYLKTVKSKYPTPVKALKGFKRIALKAGESKTVEFDISEKVLSVYDGAMSKDVVETGEYEVMLGGSSADKNLIKTSLLVNE